MNLHYPAASVIRDQRRRTVSGKGKNRGGHIWRGASLGSAPFIVVLLLAYFSGATAVHAATPPVRNACTRPEAGSVAQQPAELVSKDGKLSVILSIRNSPDPNGNMRYCYLDQHGNQAPTLRVKPGDILTLTLKNEISLSDTGAQPHGGHKPEGSLNKSGDRDPCDGGPMTAASSNLHFHGLSVPPVCHQDETLKTVIEPGDPPFEYRIQIPKTQPPGLYWYHPHVHGFGEIQLLGGASGALIVEGLQSAVPRTAGLPERVFVIRDEKMPATTPADKPDSMRPTKQLTINYVPVPYPQYPPAVIKMRPGERQLWRVLNASADTYLNLRLEFAGKTQPFNIVALDGVPLHFGEPGAATYSPMQTDVFLPPASRAEFIVTGPAQGVTARFMTNYVYRGASDDDKPVGHRSGDPAALRTGQDDVDSARPLATIIAEGEAAGPASAESRTASLELPAVSLTAVRPVRKRKLYFSEKLMDPSDPNSATQFFITEDGHSPMVFDPNAKEPTITVQQGTVEDWTIENRSRESHTFHIHQLHFIVVGSRGGRWEEVTLRDTIDLPAWDGIVSYPSVTLRMDFRDPDIIGTFPFHCHILQHLDGGMMGTVRVEPALQDMKSKSK